MTGRAPSRPERRAPGRARPAARAAERGRGLARRGARRARDGRADRGPREPGGDRAARGRLRRAGVRRRAGQRCPRPRQALPRRRADPRRPARAARLAPAHDLAGPLGRRAARAARPDAAARPRSSTRPARAGRTSRDAIRTLVVRGAPAIGVAAAFGVVLAARQSRPATADGFVADLESGHRGARRHAPHRGQPLLGARPHAPRRGRARDLPARPRDGAPARGGRGDPRRRTSRPTARWAPTARPSCPRAARILTHCNAGALATAGYGTALGVVRAAHEQGKVALRLGGRDAAR